MKLGVLGAGLFANATLLPALKKMNGLELVGIASAGGLHAQHSAKKFGFAYAASSDDEILNDPNINTVAILTRHDTHADLVVKALQAGKHVFVEKPLAIDEPGLEKVIAALGMGGVSPGFNVHSPRLTDGGFQSKVRPAGSQPLQIPGEPHRTAACPLPHQCRVPPAQPLDAGPGLRAADG